MLKPYAKYKETPALWLNSIPDHWESHKIRELFVERSEKVSDKDYSPLSVSKAGVVPQIATVAKTNNGDNRKLVRKGDFVINSRSDRRGSSGISNYDGSVSLINIVLKPRSFVNGRYMHYLLKSHYFIEEFYRNGRGIVADLWTTRYTEMKSIYLPVPSIEEQDQIVRFLNWKLAKINKLIRAKKKQIALFNEQRQAIINNAVTKGLDSHAKLKESGISGLGSIPSTWSVKPLKYWAKSNLQSLNSSTEADFEFDYLDISSVGFGYVKQEPVHYRFDEAPSRARRIVKYGDTIISTVRTYLRSITECSMQFIRDDDIKTAFVTMMNKLIFGQKFILRPLLDGLRNQNSAASFLRIEELETKIENNMEQSQMLTGLMAKGYLEPALFNKEKNSLVAERENLLAEKEQLIYSVNGNFAKIEEVNHLLRFATKSKMLTAYEDELFENYVEKIIVFSREEVGFELKCGITLKERLVN